MSSSVSQPGKPKPSHAVVIGGSLAGLCAARALVDHVDQVTVVDRDRFPDGPQVRKGVPQAHHLHVLITAGQRALDRLFPGFLAELREAGAVPVAAPTDILYLTASGWRERFPATHTLLGASRELIDWTARKRLLADERITFLSAHEAVGLVPGEGGDAIAGVELRPRDARSPDDDSPDDDSPDDGRAGDSKADSGKGTVRLAADLVVDASGRSSRTPDWLERLGYGRPDESRVDAGLGPRWRRSCSASCLRSGRVCSGGRPRWPSASAAPRPG